MSLRDSTQCHLDYLRHESFNGILSGGFYNITSLIFGSFPSGELSGCQVDDIYQVRDSCNLFIFSNLTEICGRFPVGDISYRLYCDDLCSGDGSDSSLMAKIAVIAILLAIYSCIIGCVIRLVMCCLSDEVWTNLSRKKKILILVLWPLLLAIVILYALLGAIFDLLRSKCQSCEFPKLDWDATPSNDVSASEMDRRNVEIGNLHQFQSDQRAMRGY